MYDLETRGQLVLTDGNFKLVRVLAEDVSVREAFDVAGTIVDDGGIFFAPVGVPFVDGQWGPLMYVVDADVAVLDALGDDWTTGHSALFTWGDELVDKSVDGFAMAIWEDGLGAREWYPVD